MRFLAMTTDILHSMKGVHPLHTLPRLYESPVTPRLAPIVAYCPHATDYPVLCLQAQGLGERQFRRAYDLEVNVSDQALKETVIAQSIIINALIAAVRKKDAIDLGLYNDLIAKMREKHVEDGTGKNKVFNEVIETARSAALILDQQPPSFPRG